MLMATKFIPKEHRKARMIFRCCMACALFMAACGLAKAADLLLEQDFETVAAYLPGWGAGCGHVYKPATAWKTPFIIALDTGDSHSGAKAVKVSYLEPAGGEKVFHSPGIPLSESTSAAPRRVRIRFYYRLGGLPDVALNFTPMEINGQTKSRRILNTIELNPTNEWRPVEYEGNLGWDSTQIQLLWVNKSDKVPATLWIDDVSVELLTPAS